MSSDNLRNSVARSASGDAGTYSVVAANGLGTATSQNATLKRFNDTLFNGRDILTRHHATFDCVDELKTFAAGR